MTKRDYNLNMVKRDSMSLWQMAFDQKTGLQGNNKGQTKIEIFLLKEMTLIVLLFCLLFSPGCFAQSYKTFFSLSNDAQEKRISIIK
jgi:hypothetical protein